MIVVLTAEAESDLEAIGDYIAQAFNRRPLSSFTKMSLIAVAVFPG